MHNNLQADNLDASNEFLLERRIRHITSIQVCNLTPFPIRDAFASALSQPSEQPQFTIHGHLSDDLDVTLSRKRGRKFSSASHATNRSFQSDDDNKRTVLEPRGRRSSNPIKIPVAGGSLSSGPSSSVGRTLPQPSTSPVITNKYIRSRTISWGSNKFPISNGATGSSYSANGLDNSQVNLENVISSRLVETFLAITVPPLDAEASLDIPSILATRHTQTLPRLNGHSDSGASQRKSARPQSKTKEQTTMSRRNSTAATRSAPVISTSLHSKSASVSNPRSSLKVPVSPSQSKKSPISPSPLSVAASHAPTTVPNYLSPIHLPSTNPRFTIDAKSKRNFAPWTDLTSQVLRVQVWGKTPSQLHDNGKGKQKESTTTLEGNTTQWKVLQEWSFHLSELKQVPDTPNFTSHLPSNTLLVTLSPPDQTFYLPVKRRPRLSRSRSPDVGYSSDPEIVKTLHREVDSDALPHPSDVTSPKARRRHRGRHTDSDSPLDLARTATWHDLFQLVTLQSCIIDTKKSMGDIVLGVNEILEGDYLPTLKREVSERQNVIGDLRANHAQVLDDCANLKLEIEERRRKLEERRELLALAKDQYSNELETTNSTEQNVVQREIGLQVLRSRFGPIRTTLLSTLSSIYPIDLLSPPDLLYTIVDVPLPIPISSNDPAPPLSLASHKSVNEESVATALGYVAQVVQLLAAYLGKNLVYPVTCIGSRSLIRDNISAMVGPRMFPLFSRSVDTYRFEYGVFLLNKNIEMLMSDRDLRAMDMRHTLPNLKNLLLTLTDGEGAPLRAQSLDSPLSLSSDIGSDGERSTSNAEPSTPKLKRRELSTPTESESTTPPASGSTTPTASTSADSLKWNRPFLGLAPLAGFFRYPSTSTWTSSTISSKADSEPTFHEHDDSNDVKTNKTAATEDDEDDRKTIRAVVVDSNTDDDSPDNIEGDVTHNGDGASLLPNPNNTNANAISGIEKDLSTHNPPTSSSPVAPINVNLNV